MPVAMRILWGIAIVSTLIFIIQSILTFIGADADTDFDTDLPADGDAGGDGMNLYTFRNLIHFLLGFGWTSVLLYGSVTSKFLLFLLAAVVGALFVLLTMLLFKWLGSMQQSGTIQLRTYEDTEIDGRTVILRTPTANLLFLSRTFESDVIETIPRITVRNADNWQVAQFRCGDGTYCGSAVLDGGTVTAATLVLDSGTDHKSGRIELRNGASLTVTNTGNAATLASTTSRGESRVNELIVGPNCTFSVPNGNFINGY